MAADLIGVGEPPLVQVIGDGNEFARKAREALLLGTAGPSMLGRVLVCANLGD
ncbi:MAG: hypothetical protein V2J26_07885 [Pacificimonas sp.]|nr:hypothetical protein [Pacificimonas sp.]